MRGTDRFNGSGTLKVTWLAMRHVGRYSKRLGGWLAARLWFTPWRAKLSANAQAREAGWLEGTRSLRIEVEGPELRGFIVGEGPTVLLVYGWGERASTMGAFIAPLTAAGYRVAAIDLPGHGETPSTDPNLYVIADALKRAARELGDIDAVVAHSMGGLATTVALADGLVADKVVLLAPAIRLEHGLTKFNALFDVPPRAAEGLRDHIDRRFGRDVWDHFAGDHLAAGITSPALIIHDEEDPQVDFADGRTLAESWPSARFEATRGLGHVKIVRDDEIVTRVVDFLSGRDARTEPLQAASVR